MANSITHSFPYPIRGCKFNVALPFRTAAGVATDPSSPDTEYSIDGGVTWTDCTNEITTGGSNGMGYLTLTALETNNVLILVAAKSSNCVTSFAIVQTHSLPVVAQGTLYSGSASGGFLGTILPYDISGCWFKTTGGTGGGSGSNQARRILSYDRDTGEFTCNVFETTPDDTTTYAILLPTGTTLGMLRADQTMVWGSDEAAHKNMLDQVSV